MAQVREPVRLRLAVATDLVAGLGEVEVRVDVVGLDVERPLVRTDRRAVVTVVRGGGAEVE